MSNTIDERTKAPLSLLITLISGGFVLAGLIVGSWVRQEKREDSAETAIAFVAKDVADIKAQQNEMKLAMLNGVTASEFQMWIRLANAKDPKRELPDFRK